MKPRVFIGSSVEGLNVAYAVQQNLTHDSEPTVWDQGIFDLSKTTIESLVKAVNESDFGIFIFSPDDVTKMRGNERNSIRDNVIFEFGLFTGKLGRERVFFIKPDGSDVHLPTDLVGITPGSYNPNREDGRLQAATGPACNQIREAMKKIPILSSKASRGESDESKDEDNSNGRKWVSDLIDGEYSDARKKLHIEMDKKTGEELLLDKAWMAFIDFKENEINGLGKLLDIANSTKSLKVTLLVSKMLAWEKYYDQALEIVNYGLDKFDNDPKLLVLKSEHLEEIGEKDEAIKLLSDSKFSTIPEVAVALSEKYEDDALSIALDVIHTAYAKYPSNKKVTYKYARLLQEADCHKEALYLLDYLTENHPKDVEYLGYLSNTCARLELYDRAMTALKKAIELSKEDQAWLLHNVGNLLNNKGFYSEAEEWLKKGLQIEPSSEYAHDRLSRAIKLRNEEYDKLSKLCIEGKNLIRNRLQSQSKKMENGADQ
ncbi:TIR domain-containing protein [Rheinheimera sp.]|uniref:TIR domain-containing protein n=1 Tax=Rheinheimera sp. TaxID=1869214 RepID=UPI002353CE04|nr:TIR domain-containing protein [Rheinheimera sp.]